MLDILFAIWVILATALALAVKLGSNKDQKSKPVNSIGIQTVKPEVGKKRSQIEREELPVKEEIIQHQEVISNQSSPLLEKQSSSLQEKESSPFQGKQRCSLQESLNSVSSAGSESIRHDSVDDWTDILECELDVHIKARLELAQSFNNLLERYNDLIRSVKDNDQDRLERLLNEPPPGPAKEKTDLLTSIMQLKCWRYDDNAPETFKQRVIRYRKERQLERAKKTSADDSLNDIVAFNKNFLTKSSKIQRSASERVRSVTDEVDSVRTTQRYSVTSEEHQSNVKIVQVTENATNDENEMDFQKKMQMWRDRSSVTPSRSSTGGVDQDAERRSRNSASSFTESPLKGEVQITFDVNIGQTHITSTPSCEVRPTPESCFVEEPTEEKIEPYGDVATEGSRNMIADDTSVTDNNNDERNVVTGDTSLTDVHNDEGVTEYTSVTDVRKDESIDNAYSITTDVVSAVAKADQQKEISINNEQQLADNVVVKRPVESHNDHDHIMTDHSNEENEVSADEIHELLTNKNVPDTDDAASASVDDSINEIVKNVGDSDDVTDAPSVDDSINEIVQRCGAETEVEDSSLDSILTSNSEAVNGNQS